VGGVPEWTEENERLLQELDQALTRVIERDDADEK
jgi:hypothetical protein